MKTKIKSTEEIRINNLKQEDYEKLSGVLSRIGYTVTGDNNICRYWISKGDTSYPSYDVKSVNLIANKNHHEDQKDTDK